eukprot:CAMPEP_0181110886 /NCGR_PEP_ID=MMETSP1071-20121207/18962_1 /TAXON_ID=35127 /ORGANISM="Thalassiosira sp., Strain NH16" /LENGTH=90 /DNA_ID=CAMNT_0023194705 /DNA_START=47 /DNA_END=316 /DNA_ORIENTATION=+
MRTMEVIDDMARGRYTNDLILAAEDGTNNRGGNGSGGGGMGSTSSSFEVDGPPAAADDDFDDDSSFAGSNLEADLERELYRRRVRRTAKW